MDFFTTVSNLVKDNQLLLAGLGLSGAGIITFWIKDVPKSLFRFLKRQCTTELTVTSSNGSFHEVLRWIEQKYPNKNFRKLKLTNGRWGYEKETTTSIGYGVHWITFKKRLFMVTLNKDASNQSGYDKESLTITCIGRSREVFDDFVNEVSNIDEDKTKTKLYNMDESWTYVRDQTKRSMDSIFIERAKKERLLSSLRKFINNEEWYLQNGIPYQLGILLFGPPGTGKTSLVKALAGHLNYPIYYLSPSKLGKIESAMSNLSDKSIVVIEDIDSNFLTHSRDLQEEKKSDDGVVPSEFAKLSLSQVLNSIDGMFSAHGRILIATTNHIEKLDSALIRPGRIDLKIEVGYINGEILDEFMERFFPSNSGTHKTVSIRDGTTVAELQNMILRDYGYQDILNAIS